MSLDHLTIMIDTRYRSSFLNPLDRPELRRTDWSKLETCLESGLSSKPDFPNEVAIDACVKELSSAITKAFAQSTPESRPRDDTRPLLSARTQDEIRRKK
jgi:hypothetical protein